MFVVAMQYGVRPHSGGLLGPLLLIVAGACAGGVLIPLTRLVLTRVRARYVLRRTRRRRAHASQTAERRARAMMSELCPYGWRAIVHLYEGEAVQENGEPVRGKVALDWIEMTARGHEPAVMRRVWAPTIVEALEAMVSDRATDEALEQIELRASADGVAWPD